MKGQDRQPSCLLVVEDYVWKPDVLRGDVDLGDSSVLGGIPGELVVLPFLHDRRERKSVNYFK